MHTRGMHYLTTVGSIRLAAFVTALAALTVLPALTVLADTVVVYGATGNIGSKIVAEALD